MKAFLSYSSADQEQVALLQQALMRYGHDVWFAPKDIRVGDCFASAISQALKQAEVFLLYATCHSVGNRHRQGSHEVKTELKIARERALPVIPINADGAIREGGGEGFDYLLKNYQYSLDVEAALSIHDYQHAASLINAQLLSKQAQVDTDCFDEQILHAERLLKTKQTLLASQYLAKLQLPEAYHESVMMLKVIARLQGKALKKRPKQEIDHCITLLASLTQAELQAPKLYLQALLSEHYYRKAGMADPTLGMAQLRTRASRVGRLKAKYIKMTEGLVTEQALFVSQWR